MQTYEHIRDLPEFLNVRAANTPCDCGVNSNYFLQFRRLHTTAEKRKFRRSNSCIRRCECCYVTPKETDMDKAVLWRYMHEDNQKCDKCPRCMLLPCLTLLHQLSTSLSLLQFDRTDKSQEQHEREKREAFAKVAFPASVLRKLPGGTDRCDASIQSLKQFFMLSGKLKELHSLLKNIEGKRERVLLFSGSTQTLDLIQNYMKFESYSFLRIDGSTPSGKRQG